MAKAGITVEVLKKMEEGCEEWVCNKGKQYSQKKF
jgi:hypothetical protein